MSKTPHKRTGTHGSGFQLLVFVELVPVIVGLVLFTAWRVTGADWIIEAGLYTLVGGAVLVGLGLVVALVLAKVAWASSGRALAVIASLAALNVFVAFGLGKVVLDAKTAYRVEVHNASAEPLFDVRLVGGGLDESLGEIGPGETVTASLWFEAEGPLKLWMFQGSSFETAEVDGYVCANLGGDLEVIVGADGTIEAVASP